MARVAFYAPMKPPDHPTPSGDREMARNLMSAISAPGDQVDLISRLRVHDKTGDAALQQSKRAAADDEAARLIAEMPADTAIWVTYHNYYKAPDLLGPQVCAARDIPYVQVESTRASSRLSGPWHAFARAAHQACDAARIIFYQTENDRIALQRDLNDCQRLVRLDPFLPLSHVPAAANCTGAMVAVGMMRYGDKLASYRVLADALDLLTGAWHLNIAGDGPARDEVEALFAPFGDRVTFLGQLDQSTLRSVYSRSSVLVWPGVNEAYGMIYLEAQAAGLPVAAQDRPGVRDVLSPADYPTVDLGARGLADYLQKLLNDPDYRRKLGRAAQTYVTDNHLIQNATTQFWSAVRPLIEDRV
ncbi:MAG: glycosyltransferase family 4 protein [Pseudomonadota bacterium]